MATTDAKILDALVAEAIEATCCDDLAEIPVALAEDPSILRGWLSLAYRRGLADGMAERDELRAAAQALVADLESDEGHWPGWCDHPRCRRLFTLTDGKGCTCDEHQGDLIAERLQDCSYTPALRRLMGTKKEGA